MGKIRGPRNWREYPGLMEAYEEVGRSIGRSILYDETMEEYYWKLFKPIETWPRWFLFRFRTLYREEHPEEVWKVRERRAARRRTSRG